MWMLKESLKEIFLKKCLYFFLINASNILENQLYNKIETSINIPEFFSDFLTI